MHTLARSIRMSILRGHAAFAAAVLMIFLLSCATMSTADFVSKAQVLIGTSSVSTVCPAGPCGLTGFYLTFTKLYPKAVSAEDDAQVRKSLADVTAPAGLLDQLKSAATAADQAADLRGVVSVASQVIGIIAANASKIPNLDPAIAIGFTAASVLIPILSQVADNLIGQKSVAAVSVPKKFQSKDMTEAQALVVLRR